MKTHQILLLATLLITTSTLLLQAGEVPWTPETPYNYDRRQSASVDDPSPWAIDHDYRRIEYRLVYLMEADRSAKKLERATKLPEAESLLLHRSIDNLDEVLEVCYREAIACFKAKPNPTLLLMMIYHYSAYVNSAMERWDPTIDALRKLDPAITEEAVKLVSSSKEQKSK
jgi:hypothetical protein